MKKYALTIFLAITFTATYALSYILDEETFFNDKVKVLIPTNFSLADDELITQRYGNGANVPKVIYTDESQTALLSLNITANEGNRDTIVKLYKLVKDDIRSKHPEHRFLKTDVIRNRRLANIEVIMPNADGEMIYSMMGFMYVGRKFFSFNFSCSEEDMPKWQNMAREIAENLKLVR